MSEPVQPMVIDLSHWDPAYDYDDVMEDGIVAVIYKATEGQGYQDDTYVEQQHAAKAAGLKWGAYHFADASNVDGQVRNFMDFACPDPDELFCLDWEDNPSGAGKMSKSQAQDWIEQVESALGRPGECVIYGGNTLKENLDSGDTFFGERRLWLCQYGSTPSLPAPWDAYWLWQFTDGIYGPSPHSIDGVGPCDINSYQGTPEQLIAEWTEEGPAPRPPRPPQPSAAYVDVIIAASGEVVVTVNGQPISGPSELPPERLSLRKRLAQLRKHRAEKEAKP